MRPNYKSAHSARPHSLPIIYLIMTYQTLAPLAPIVATTNTTHYNMGKFLASILDPLAQNEFTLSDVSETASSIQNIPQHLFNDGYQFVLSMSSHFSLMSHLKEQSILFSLVSLPINF